MRNLLTIARAAMRPVGTPDGTFECGFRVMPWDVGVATFKSDRYFAVAEAAQLDWLVRTRLLRPLLAAGVSWVNLGQSSRLERPLRLFRSFSVRTQVQCVDAKHAYFAHRFVSAEGTHAHLLVKAKFKQGRLTVPPAQLLGAQSDRKTAAILALDELLRTGD